MNREQVERTLADCDLLVRESANAIASAPPRNTEMALKECSDAMNRLVIAQAFEAKGMLGVQLESIILREQMAKAHEQGQSIDPGQINDALQGEG